VPWHRTPHFG